MAPAPALRGSALPALALLLCALGGAAAGPHGLFYIQLAVGKSPCLAAGGYLSGNLCDGADALSLIPYTNDGAKSTWWADPVQRWGEDRDMLDSITLQARAALCRAALCCAVALNGRVKPCFADSFLSMSTSCFNTSAWVGAAQAVWILEETAHQDIWPRTDAIFLALDPTHIKPYDGADLWCDASPFHNHLSLTGITKIALPSGPPVMAFAGNAGSFGYRAQLAPGSLPGQPFTGKRAAGAGAEWGAGRRCTPPSCIRLNKWTCDCRHARRLCAFWVLANGGTNLGYSNALMTLNKNATNIDHEFAWNTLSFTEYQNGLPGAVPVYAPALPSQAGQCWHFLTVTKSPTTVSFYWKGALTTSWDNTAQITWGSNDLAIGIDWASKGLNFKGNLGTISLYNQALTAAEVQALYNRDVAKYAANLCT
ncbi:hypothetical protein CHLNCDRAFT_141309 [Chlorella variabilis]|uniref:LamG-like jellyroll fold domain-containing protein n=1 Tax=Chlorella variabilis TaxID=554065 RepID=E1ZSL0_CHLVA|nr:hypothetical protein CHLNCDRAFT_141309 [Chlorella variabilis]EFN51171.1 hypothetical protein CHLNCDRAFT_141309 [Chlorella variabilis]|eukprot:XP_005843273.1 hypothetical protein CHLNCDRAFT_141309 [Chlorella variabilis]